MTRIEMTITTGKEAEILGHLSAYCATAGKPLPKQSFELKAGMIEAEIANIRQLIKAITADQNLDAETKRKFIDMLANWSLKLKKSARGVPTHPRSRALKRSWGLIPTSHRLRAASGNSKPTARRRIYPRRIGCAL